MIFSINFETMIRYLLSSGQATDLVEYYILDLFKLYLKIFPGDIPGAPDLGFDFNLGNTKKTDIPMVLQSKISQLISKLQERFTSGITLSLESLDIISETTAKVVIRVNNVISDEIYFNIYNKKTT